MLLTSTIASPQQWPFHRYSATTSSTGKTGVDIFSSKEKNKLDYINKNNYRYCNLQNFQRQFSFSKRKKKSFAQLKTYSFKENWACKEKLKAINKLLQSHTQVNLSHRILELFFQIMYFGNWGQSIFSCGISPTKVAVWNVEIWSPKFGFFEFFFSFRRLVLQLRFKLRTGIARWHFRWHSYSTLFLFLSFDLDIYSKQIIVEMLKLNVCIYIYSNIIKLNNRNKGKKNLILW